MASITYDGRSFMLDGRRLWVVSGSIHFQRVAPEDWGDRLRQAKHAGLNCIETPVFWNRVETRPGQFSFKGPDDIAAFCKLAHEHDLHVILRPGPYVGAGWDLGGLPVWLLDLPEVELRTANAPFLEAVGRYYTALARQVKSLQATQGGSILLVQAEHNWTCGHDETAQGYLGELARYLREGGFAVPRLNANNLWQGIEGDIETWSGDGRLFATVRQLGTVRPDQPRMVSQCGTPARPVFGEDAPEVPAPAEVQRRLGEVLAAGGQFNIAPFASGTTSGFWGGQSSLGTNTFLTPTQDVGAPVGEDGRLGDSYGPVRRLCTFASSFARVLANLDHDAAPVFIDPSGALGQSARESKGAGWSVIHASGSQGSVAYLFAPAGRPTPGKTELLLPDGSALTVATGQQSVHWCVFNVALSPRTVLDYSSLCVLTSAEDVLVCFGPAGAEGHLSINGTPIHVDVPKGRKPAVVRHEDATVVVVSEDVADETILTERGVYVGVREVTDAGPVGSGKSKTCTLVAPDGSVSSASCETAHAPGSKKIELGAWKAAPASAHAGGTSPRYAKIPGPANMAQLGSAYGYGWYRMQLRLGKGRRASVATPDSADRVHLIVNGEPLGVLGRGPGAEDKLALSLPKGDHTVVALVDNMGRVSGGSDQRERRGLCGHVWETAVFKTQKPKLVEGDPIEPLGWKTPLYWVREGDATHPSRIAWSFKHLKKSPVFLSLPALPVRTLVVVNDEPVEFIDAHRPALVALETETVLKRGNNDVQVCVLPDAFEEGAALEEVKAVHAQISANATLTEGVGCLTETAAWSFAKWEPPTKTAYKEVAKSSLNKLTGPTWWRCAFDDPSEHLMPLSLDLSGMTKGQVFLNGQNAGRYFLQTAAGDKVPPMTRMVLPRAALKEKNNELVIFDEHGGNPGRVKLSREW